MYQPQKTGAHEFWPSALYMLSINMGLYHLNKQF